MSMKPEKMTHDQLHGHIQEYLGNLRDKSGSMSDGESEHVRYLMKLKDERHHYEEIRARLDDKDLSAVRLADFTIHDVRMAECGCCQENYEDPWASGLLEDGRIFTINGYGLEIEDPGKKSIIW